VTTLEDRLNEGDQMIEDRVAEMGWCDSMRVGSGKFLATAWKGIAYSAHSDGGDWILLRHDPYLLTLVEIHRAVGLAETLTRAAADSIVMEMETANREAREARDRAGMIGRGMG